MLQKDLHPAATTMLSARCMASVLTTVESLHSQQGLLPGVILPKDVVMSQDFSSGFIERWSLEVVGFPEQGERFPLTCIEGNKSLKLCWVVVNILAVFLNLNVEPNQWSTVMAERLRDVRTKQDYQMSSFDFIKKLCSNDADERPNFAMLTHLLDKGVDYLGTELGLAQLHRFFKQYSCSLNYPSQQDMLQDRFGDPEGHVAWFRRSCRERFIPGRKPREISLSQISAIKSQYSDVDKVSASSKTIKKPAKGKKTPATRKKPAPKKKEDMK